MILIYLVGLSSLGSCSLWIPPVTSKHACYFQCFDMNSHRHGSAYVRLIFGPPQTHFQPLFFANTFSVKPREWSSTERRGVVIAMDPFLYESWHSRQMGRATFWRGGNGFFSFCCSLRWAECKLHPARPRRRVASASYESLPSSSPVRSWEMFPSRRDTATHIIPAAYRTPRRPSSFL